MIIPTSVLVPLLAFLATSSASPCKRDSSYLPSSYINPSFGQAKANVYSQAKKSVTALTQRSDYPGGWVGENANTVVSQWDGQQGTRDYYDFIVGKEENWSNNPGGCHDYWQSPGESEHVQKDFGLILLRRELLQRRWDVGRFGERAGVRGVWRSSVPRPSSVYLDCELVLSFTSWLLISYPVYAVSRLCGPRRHRHWIPQGRQVPEQHCLGDLCRSEWTTAEHDRRCL